MSVAEKTRFSGETEMTVMQVPQPDEAGYWIMPKGDCWTTEFEKGVIWGDHCPLTHRLSVRTMRPEWLRAAYQGMNGARVVWTLILNPNADLVHLVNIYNQKVELAFPDAASAMYFKMNWF